jgi:hypothetical protein
MASFNFSGRVISSERICSETVRAYGSILNQIIRPLQRFLQRL